MKGNNKPIWTTQETIGGYFGRSRKNKQQIEKYFKVFINDLNGKSFNIKRSDLKHFKRTGNKKYLLRSKHDISTQHLHVSKDRTFIITIKKPNSSRRA